MMRPVYLFDDGLPLAPLTDLRPAFDVRTGALTTLERVEIGWGRPISGLIVPTHLEALTRELHPDIPVNRFNDDSQDAFLLNGRWVECLMTEELSDLDPRSALVTRDLGVLAACGPVRDFHRLARDESDGYTQIEHESGEATPTISRPWHIKSFRDQAIQCDLHLIIAHRKNMQRKRPSTPPPHNGQKHQALIDPTANIHPSAVIETEGGDVLIEAHATVRPGAVITGPACIGPHSTVLDHATIRANTAIGPWCKVGGEVSGVIFQGYSNKAHEGYLGDSYVGEWVNLGAGTTNSNLLNTYDEITACAMPGAPNERTGEQFLGATIGDHVKTAIGTRIMTGAVIHTGAMLARTAPATGCIPPFAWMTDEALRVYRLPRFLETVRTMMARRGITPSDAYLARITDLATMAASAARG